MTQAAIFRHFPTKAELWCAVGEALARRLRTAWVEALAGAEAPEGRLRALIDAQLAQIEASPAVPAILCSRELGVENPALRACRCAGSCWRRDGRARTLRPRPGR